MTISLDFDNTYSRDPFFWDEFIRLAQTHGHDVVMITGRDDTPEHRDTLRDAVGVPLLEKVFCNHRLKRLVCEEKGVDVHVWIDDLPEGIGIPRENS